MAQITNASNSVCQIEEVDDSDTITVYHPPSQDKIYDAATDVFDGTLLFARGLYKFSHTLCTDVLIPAGKTINKYIKNLIIDNSEIGYQEDETDNMVIYDNDMNE